MKKSIKAILFFILFYGIYYLPITIIIFIIGVFLNNISNFWDQGTGWYVIIVSYFISFIISTILSILTVKKVVLNKEKEDGTKEKTPKYIYIFIIVALLIIIAIIAFYIYAVNMNSQNIYDIDEPDFNPTIYNMNVSKEIYNFGYGSYVSNLYMHDIKNKYEDSYIINFDNLKFRNNTYKLSYIIKDNKKIISIDDNKIVNMSSDNENKHL